MTTTDKNELVVRRATVKDVPAMSRIINHYASQGLMLPRSHHKLYQDIRDFVVVTVDGKVIACGALHVVWEDLGEIRSLAMVQEWIGKGIGRRIVDSLMAEAHSLGLPRLFTLTYRQGFFERMGFHVVSRESLPHKIWGDCLDCPKFPNCDEIAMILDLDSMEEEEESREG